MAETGRVLLCCEAGGGRGHETALATIARVLEPDRPRQAILPRLTHAALLEPLCDRVDRGPHLRKMAGLPKVGGLNWANWLYYRGFADPKTLRDRFSWWCESLQLIQPALVVADFAPTALMAARAHGIPTIATGPAFGLPPATLPDFPQLLNIRQAAMNDIILHDGPQADEAAICAVINQTLGPLGLPELTALPQVYTTDLALPRGLDIWDPYTAWRDHPLVPPVETMPTLHDHARDEIFIYLPPHSLTEPAIMGALRDLPLPARLVTSGPGADAEAVQKLADNPRLKIEATPLSHAQIVECSRLILCAGQAGTMGLAVLAGIPVLALPTEHEHLSNAARASARLAGCRMVPARDRRSATILAAIRDIISDPTLASTARHDAQVIRDRIDSSALDAYHRQLAPVLNGLPITPPGQDQHSYTMFW